MPRTESLGGAWRRIQKQLIASGIAPISSEGRQLVAHVLKLTDKQLRVQEGDPFPTLKLAELDDLAMRRGRGEPLGYVVGQAPFWQRDWAVGPGVLIPRPDSEILLREAMARTHGRARVIEVGVGSGAVIGSLLGERKEAVGVATDVSEVALKVARGNLEAAGVLGRCELRHGDLLANAEGPFDVVLSNPPYIADHEWDELDGSVKDFEPEGALRAGAEGMDVYVRLIPAAHFALKRGGWLCLEIGWTQGVLVKRELQDGGFEEVEVLCDLAGRDRVVVGRKV